MKEATGEANITVITIVLIAIVLAVGTVIVNSVLSNAKASSCCTSIGGSWVGGRCCNSKSYDSDKKTCKNDDYILKNDSEYSACIDAK